MSTNSANNNIKSKNIFAVDHRVDLEERWDGNGHKGGILWFTGLSGSGKTTLALELERQLIKHRYQAFVLDGDNIRGGLNRDLDFSPEGRSENIRRIAEVAALFSDAGQIAIAAFISPYEEDRQIARTLRPDLFHEVFINSDLAVCEQRDPKGLYKKARAGEIPEFTGISAPYEEPANPELVIDTAEYSVLESVYRLMDYVGSEFTLQGQVKEVA